MSSIPGVESHLRDTRDHSGTRCNDVYQERRVVYKEYKEGSRKALKKWILRQFLTLRRQGYAVQGATCKE